MLKLLGSVMVISAAALIGYVYSKTYTDRVKQIREMQYALNMLETEIIYNYTPLHMALLSAGEKSTGAIKELFSKMSDILNNKKINSVLDAFDEAYKLTKTNLYFEKEETEIIKSFIQSLGTSDMEGQKKNFNITVKKLEAFEKKADEERKKNERLFQYLGVCFGVLIIILLV